MQLEKLIPLISEGYIANSRITNLLSISPQEDSTNTKHYSDCEASWLESCRGIGTTKDYSDSAP